MPFPPANDGKPISRNSTSRRTLVKLALGAAGIVATGAMPASARQSSEQPNIILILTDDMRADDLAHMPAVQSLLVDQGVTLTNFLATNPSCAPARASILRGQYAHNHGVMRSKGDVGGIEQFLSDGDEDSTIATWLQDAGMRTALVGKYLNGYGLTDDLVYIPPGWSDWAGITREGYSRFEINEGGTLVRYRSKEEAVYSTDVLARLATSFVASAGSARDPFFMLIAPRAPHGPAEPANRHRTAFDDVSVPQSAAMNEADVSDKPDWIAELPLLSDADQAEIENYYRARLQTLLAVDELVALLVSALEEADLLETTFLLLSSDNGYALGEHRLRQEKGSPYSESSILPMVARGPGIAPGTTLDVLASQADLAPTFAEWAGASVPDFVDGRSLASVIAGKPAPDNWRQVALIEHAESEFDETGRKPTWTALRGQEFLYTSYNTGEQELYDLNVDPYQVDNLATTTDAAILEHLADRAQRMSTCQGETCRSIESESLPANIVSAS